MSYHVVICDDDIHFIRYMKRMLLTAGLSDADAVFYEYQNGSSLMDNLEKLPAVDLLILDIQMPDMDGYETASRFRQSFPLSLLIFCSGIYLPTVQSFETQPFRYLLKEYADSRMLSELKAIVAELSKRKTEPYIYAVWHYNTVRLAPSEILYLSLGRGCTQVHINPESKKYSFEDNIICKKRLPELYSTLKDHDFEYAHNSYLVNLQYVKRKTLIDLELMDGTILTIARSKEKAFRMAMAKYMAKKY